MSQSGRYLQALSDSACAEAIVANTFVGYDYNECGAGAPALGVSEEDCNIGDLVDVRHIGTAWVLLSADVAQGVPIMSDGAGKGLTATSGNYINGFALTAGSNGGLVEIVLTHGAKMS